MNQRFSFWSKISIVLSFFIIVTSYANVLSSSAFSSSSIAIKLRIGSDLASINDRQIQLEVAPFLKSQRTMVPLRFIGEAFGADLEWVPNPKISGEGMILVEFTKQKKLIKMHTRLPLAFIETHMTDGVPSIQTIKLDVEPFVVKPQNRTVVPLRFIGEAMNAEVHWNGEDQSIRIVFNN